MGIKMLLVSQQSTEQYNKQAKFMFFCTENFCTNIKFRGSEHILMQIHVYKTENVSRHGFSFVPIYIFIR